ncbi:MAG: energy transducer TonB [Candidatus Latescibacteria bacterium]|jgi:periplasmic protein TonB|nr:energy transducer TonB [Candidatus Latescibacterota bacterium]
MNTSTVHFKRPSADLHRKSRIIFLASLIVSIFFTTMIIIVPLPYREQIEQKIEAPPVIIKLENIPETRQTVMLPAPALPFDPDGLVIEVEDDMIPDDVTIESTELDLKAAAPPSPPAAILASDPGASAEEDEIFEYFAVEEPPARAVPVIPEYPEIAERAGIEGNVTMKVLVNKEGLVDSVEVIGGPKVFHKSSIEAARKTKFTPAKHMDRAVSCWVIMPFKFELEKQ